MDRVRVKQGLVSELRIGLRARLRMGLGSLDYLHGTG